jgi:uncharacterized protein involved in oxidation of intracellular sulfur
MSVLFIVNDAPYGSEKAYNALRLAMALGKEQAEVRVRVFLMADAVATAVSGQTTPNGYYNLERMVRAVLAKGGEVALCGSCMDARGLKLDASVDGVQRGSMSQLARWTVEAEKVLVF